MEAIKSATLSAATLLGISDRTGSIEKGKIADIIAVNGDPLQDIKVLSIMQFVMKEGVIYKHNVFLRFEMNSQFEYPAASQLKRSVTNFRMDMKDFSYPDCGP